MNPTYFPTSADFRAWLEQNHQKESELIVGYYKVNCGKPGMTWSQSVDEALCFGWIDGVRRSVDEERYCIRFTPRKPSSIWSAVNINKIEELTQKGLMQPAGIAAYEKRQESKSKIYAFEQEEVKLSDSYEEQFKANKIAWQYFEALAPSYKKLSTHWVMSAKQEATQQKRLGELIAHSEGQTNPWKDNKYSKK